MKKTLLIAAAALVAGMLSVQAQSNVYSQNIVGYVNQTIPANSFQIIGGTLVNGSDASKTNGDINTTLTGMISDPNGPPYGTNTVLYIYDYVHGGVASYYYFNATDINTWQGSPGWTPGWYDSLGTPLTFSLTPGVAVFLQNKFSQPIAITSVGTIFQGTNIQTIQSGFNLISFNAPVSDKPDSTNSYGLPVSQFTSSSIGDFNNNDVIYVWDTTHGGIASFMWFNAADINVWQGSPGWESGFYDSLGTPMPAYDFPQANQGFYIFHNGASFNWTNSFSVK